MLRLNLDVVVVIVSKSTCISHFKTSATFWPAGADCGMEASKDS